MLAVDVSFLPHMDQLTSLQLYIPRFSTPTPAVIAAFACPQLTSLDIQAPFTSADMAVLLARLPLLSSLTLTSMPELESLVFFTECEAAKQTLHTLKIVGGRSLDLLQTHEFVHLAPLQSLVSLSLCVRNELPVELVASACQLLAVPSALLPRLERFEAKAEG